MVQQAKDLKAKAAAAIDGSKEELYQLSDEIWRNPELGFEEHKAHELLTAFLEKKGFTVEQAFTGLKTAFRATFGSGRPNVCVICEYDALPGIGHACGHNLIAEAGVAAGLGLKAALESSGAPKGRVTVMGTPDEEGEGRGKIILLDNGAFEDVDFAMMVHAAPYTVLKPIFSAVGFYMITYTGKAAHAAAFPWEGVNALDAAVIAYNSISVLRQQLKPTWNVHGVITNGGVKPNIIPEKTEMEFWVWAPNRAELRVATDKVMACFHGAATATGCTIEISQRHHQEQKVTDNLLSNDTLAQLYGEHLKNLGMDFVEQLEEIGSTDMGNVSHAVPSIHPMYKIGTGEVYHTRDFTTITNMPDAHEKTLTAAKAMAYTAIDVLTTEGLLEEVKT